MTSTTRLLIASALVVFAGVLRLMPHEPNMTPLVAVALLAGMYMGRKWAFAVPFCVLLATDFLIGFYDWRVMVSVYGSVGLIAALSFLVRSRRSFVVAGSAAVAASLIFFLLTNAAVWLFSPWYAKDIAGLLYAYELGLPFLRNMMLGDIFYTVGLLAVFKLVQILVQQSTLFPRRLATDQLSTK